MIFLNVRLKYERLSKPHAPEGYVFPGDPRNWEQTKYKQAELSELGKKLLGLKNWTQQLSYFYVEMAASDFSICRILNAYNHITRAMIKSPTASLASSIFSIAPSSKLKP